MKPLRKTKIKWSPNFAYAIGLLTTDGNLSPDGRHMSLVSKDREQLENFRKCLGLKNKIGITSSGSGRDALRVQFGDVNFYRFLVQIGLMPNKTKILKKVDIPDRYFFDFLRGHFDGDGSSYSYWDPRWKSSYMFYVIFVSASKNHIVWLREIIRTFLNIKGHVTKSINDSAYQLKYAKRESLILLPKLYYDNRVVCLSRKRKKIERMVRLNNT
jgi:hypothetical protein